MGKQTMSESEDWHALRKRVAKFMEETELGKLYRTYDNATIAYWRNDANEDISPAKLKALEERMREATNAFVAKLMELAGV
jgi:hypothetical protein